MTAGPNWDIDRLLGFGLKYQAGFKFTHLSTPKSAPKAHPQDAPV
ncbi:MAG: DUF4260 family protein [Methylocella sp.]